MTIIDVFETNEDKAVREKKEREARWDKLVAQAQAADPNKCQALVYHDGSFRGYQCTKKAKFHREEHVGSAEWIGEGEDRKWENVSPMITKHYCGLHDLISATERQNKRYAEDRRERDEKWAREERARQRSCAVSKACARLTNDQCQKFAVFVEALYATCDGATEVARAIQFQEAFAKVLGGAQ